MTIHLNLDDLKVEKKTAVYESKEAHPSVYQSLKK